MTIGQIEERIRWPLAAAYFVGFWTLGGTPGMREMRLVLEGLGAERPTLIAAVIRFVILGGVVALAGATVLFALAAYALVCAFGAYPHDLVARTIVRHETSGPTGVGRVLSRCAYAVGLLFFGLMVVGLVLGVAFGGLGDPSR